MAQFRGGYTGRMLRVNLDDGHVTLEKTPDECKWLGPRGWNALIAWNEVLPGVGPFDPANRIVFSVGPLVGTHAPASGRMTVSTISPRGYPQPMWTSGSMGGYFGAELKYARYDGIVLHGCANSPCYLLIEDGEVTLEDGSDLWGRGVFSTQRMLKKRHSQRHQVVAIGPAGENRVRFASMTHRLANSLGNGGFGGVMGAKRVKAIVVRGTGGVSIADPGAFLDAVSYVWSLVKGGQSHVGQPDMGWPFLACTHACSAKCRTQIREVSNRLDVNAPLNMTTCMDESWIEDPHAGYEGVEYQGKKLRIPQPPGFGRLGPELGNLAEDMGITTWVYDTWYRWFGALGLLGINQVLGEPIELENPEWWREWMVNVSHRRGTGAEYAEGLARFFGKHSIGPRHLAEFLESAGSRGHGWHRDGRAMESHPSPFWQHGALLYAVSTRDVSPSTHGYFFLTRLRYPDGGEAGASEVPRRLASLAKRVYGSAKTVEVGDEYIEQVTVWHQHRSVIKDSLGLCDWIYPVLQRNFDTTEEYDQTGDLYGDTRAEALLYRTCTGIEMSIQQMESPVAERIVNLERCVDVRNHGRYREADEAVIPHFQWPEKTDGTHFGEDANDFRGLLDRYYDVRGWERQTGWPARSKLRELGLKAVAAELAKLKK